MALIIDGAAAAIRRERTLAIARLRVVVASGATFPFIRAVGNVAPVTVLYPYSYSGEKEVVTDLLRAGADPNKKNKYGVSPRDLAFTIANQDTSKFFK